MVDKRDLKIFLVLLAAVLVFVIFNFPYFIEQAKYYIGKTDTREAEKIVLEPEKMEPDTLVIESLGITAPIVYVSENSEKVFQKALESGVVHYPNTAEIGEVGNAYIFGHSSDYLWSKGNYKTVFALVPQIKIGDKIIASNNQGKVFTYEVVETKIVAPDDTSVLAQDLEKRFLSVQTSYPIGTALRRFIVVAKLAE